MGRNILTVEGADERGVPLLRGNADDVPIFIVALFSCLSIVTAAAVIGSLLTREFLQAASFAVACAVTACMARYYFRLRKRLSQIDSAYMLRKHLKLSQNELDTVIATYAIKPVYNLNGTDLYDLADFGEKATLLRASAPTSPSPDTLLRPGVHAATVATEQLLRAAE